jgi:hypothetical protein
VTGAVHEANGILSIPAEIDGRRVTGIGEGAFYGCTNVVDIVLPDCIERVGYEAFANSFNCCQSTLAGLMREFLPDDPALEVLVASAGPLASGANRGHTCGVVNGGLLFIGRLYYKDMTTTYRELKAPPAGKRGQGVATEYTFLIEERLGSVFCRHIQQKTVGKYYDLLDFNNVVAFCEAGARERCQDTVEAGIRAVCELVLDEEGNIKG